MPPGKIEYSRLRLGLIHHPGKPGDGVPSVDQPGISRLVHRRCNYSQSPFWSTVSSSSVACLGTTILLDRHRCGSFGVVGLVSEVRCHFSRDAKNVFVWFNSRSV